MGLDIHGVQSQLDALASNLQSQTAQHHARLQQAIQQLRSADADAINGKRTQGRFAWPVPAFPLNPAAHHSPTLPPPDYRALATDGSRIDIDRHLPVRCALLNISKVLLRYGATPDARLDSTPHLYTGDDQLALTDPDSTREQLMEGALLGLKSSVEELAALAELAEESADDTATLALVDGSLILWGPTIQAYPDYVRRAFIDQGLLPALDRLKAVASRQPLALAAYISLPGSTGVADALRLAVCPYDPVNCDQHCGRLQAGQRPCDSVGGLLDRELFANTLSPGERSELFTSTSSIVEEYYGDHAVAFYYLNVGEEMARVEVPAWVAQDETLLNLSHSLILDQCRRGLGYPVAIMEAHEQAVITGQDRELFRRMVEDALAERHLPVYTSEKARSKRQRSL
ncbi:MAG: DNA double-strand break repair nuclease NurA [Chloroflexi bacterium]|nr:DNA double-strand break repair nuclease NurA [Chloroflexota bacterium]